MQKRYIIGIGIIAIASIASIYLLSEAQVQYTTIQDARLTGKKVQIKGQWVERDEAYYDQLNNSFYFTLADETGEKIKVIYNGAKPNHLELAEAIVVRGRVEGSYFLATDILTKCPSKYEGAKPLSTQIP
ncbi:MAG: cytochrome c maturation protein CcmE [Bacteroidota bacterium]|nr:cytochrome c maturation protein CcmE [Candidatus Kapabacteria bacterium]MCS7302639.1 cytochrome c maturation protein CcmE [Candidatus Kapabacteria bacterium]MCX7936246.1 cytochrome c maturation protein CcmE [Chlorobiota bacterium]MDW8074473.1 cytochrome c maturation protein CcmE [Bacteroidota bacterium]MDW8271051.1 cytochrome c maturation protein CcmE [Bacteroidota bacterium]